MKKRKISLAWKQLIRQKGRFIIAIAGISFADILILMQLGFQSALLDTNTLLPKLIEADIILTSSQAQNFGLLKEFPRRRLFQAKNLPQVESADALYVSLGNWKNPDTKTESTILVLGFNPARPAFNLPEVKQNLKLIQYPDTLLFDGNSRGEYENAIAKITKGKSVTTELQARRISIKGLYRVGSSFIADGSLITSDQNFLRIFKGRTAGEVSLGLIKLKPDSDENNTVTELKSLLPSDVKVFTLKEFIASEKNYWQTSTSIGFIFSFGVVVGFLVGVIIVYQILFSDVSDHLPEYATLKAIGYSNFYLLRVVFQEAIILAVCGYIPGCLISIGLYEITRSATSLPLIMPPSRIILSLGFTIVMCVASGAIAVRKLGSADPADIF
ncbi:MAG: ABC transporter permease DevC [Rivularia sp. (in: cyanobacteria)]